MRETKTLKRLRGKLEACPEVSKVEFKEGSKSHVPNVVEARVTLNTLIRSCLEKTIGEYKREYEPISEVWFTKVGKWNVVFIIV